MEYRFIESNSTLEIPIGTVNVQSNEDGILQINTDEIISNAMQDYIIRGVVEVVEPVIEEKEEPIAEPVTPTDDSKVTK